MSVPRDFKTSTPIYLDFLHYKAHQGHLFRIDMIATNTADSATAEMLIDPGSKETHVNFIVGVPGDAQAELLFNVSVTANGASLTAFRHYNESDGSVNTTTVQFYQGPTGATGTVMARQFINGGSFPKQFGGGGAHENEFILEGGLFLVRVHNLSGAVGTIGLTGELYELD